MYKLEDLSTNVQLLVEAQGLRIKCNNTFDFESLKFAAQEIDKASNFFKLIAQTIPILFERELIEKDGSDLLIRNDSIHEISALDLGWNTFLPDFNPYTLEIRAENSIGNQDFKFETSFFLGAQEISSRVEGTFLKRGTAVYLLHPKMYKMLLSMNEFNELGAVDKTKTSALLAFANVKDLSSDCYVAFDNYLENENVTKVSSIGINIDEEPDGKISLYPEIAGVPDDEMKRSFMRLSDVQEVYDISLPGGGRMRVVMPDNISGSLKKMKAAARVSGKRKDKILSNPREYFSDLENADALDFGSFGPRVKGIGAYVFQAKPFIKARSGKFLEEVDNELFSKDSNSEPNFDIGITAQDAEGNGVTIPLETPEKLVSIHEKVRDAVVNGDACVSLEDTDGTTHLIPVTHELNKGLEGLVKRANATKSDTPPSEKTSTTQRTSKEDMRYVLIFENEDAVEYSESVDNELSKPLTFLPSKNLIDELDGKPFALKDYQKEGVAWLQRSLQSVVSEGQNRLRRGGLLADDMGLGKTLQILTFLAWCIEDPLREELGTAKGPYKPILVIAPVILLEVWKKEIERFFKHNGDIFLPFEILYGDKLKEYKRNSEKGKEFETGISKLNIDALRTNRLIITNYDTVKNYQHSFALTEWSVVVIDEAQEIKEQKTAVTYAVKSLNALFKIALTGTPVENRLLDLWSIVDFFQPGLLGSAKDFSRNYESDEEATSIEERLAKAEELRSKLNYGTINAHLIRRTKLEKLDGLPEKLIHIRETPLSAEQEALHSSILKIAKEESARGKKGSHLTAIQQLNRSYQHICLETDTQIDRPASHYLKSSPKLHDVIKLLQEIRGRGEKVLIFALFTKMQLMLQKVISEEFKFEPAIINGSVKSGAGGSVRHSMISAFEAKQGFNAMILSPDVAGVGLTIVGANNVIHYGRWWNPAKEAQATDRVYRLGQTKTVNVYYPISVSNRFATFDQKLHQLLERKRELASNFLVPSGNLEINTGELFASLEAHNVFPTMKVELDLKTLDRERFEALAACILGEQGYETYLTPDSQNAGIDVIANKENKKILLATVDFLNDNSDSSFLPESINNSVRYYQKIFKEKNKFISADFAFVYLTNKILNKQDRKRIQSGASQIYDLKDITDLLKKSTISTAKITAQISTKFSTLQDLASEI